MHTVNPAKVFLNIRNNNRISHRDIHFVTRDTSEYRGSRVSHRILVIDSDHRVLPGYSGISIAIISCEFCVTRMSIYDRPTCANRSRDEYALVRIGAIDRRDPPLKVDAICFES